MCNTCKQNKLHREFEAVLHNEFEEELYPELEWSNYYTKAKSYVSPFFNWISTPAASPVQPVNVYPKSAPGYGTPPSALQLVQAAIAGGQRNENTLTDLVFFKQHPELGSKMVLTSHPGFNGLSKEWLTIRDTIVRPALQKTAPPNPVVPGPSSGGGTGSFVQIPVSGPGFTRKVSNGQTQPADRVWGHPIVIRALVTIGAKWKQLNPSAPRMQIGDISFQNGGKMDPHSSHQKGIDIDIRPVRNDGGESPVKYTDAAYSRALTQQLVDMIRNNGVLSIKSILFNDSGIKGVTTYPHHDDHLHVTFNQP